MIWLKDIRKWNALPLLDKVKAVKKYLCTGPCGQSSSISTTRSALELMFNDILKFINDHEKRENNDSI